MEEEIDNPLRAKGGLLKFISVVPSDGVKYKGWLKTIDPVSGSLVLVNFSNGKPSAVDIIMGHSYQNIEVLDDCDPEMREKVENLFCSTMSSFSKEQIQKFKENIISWFVKNRMPVVEEDSEVLCVANAVKISPPYGIEQCQSTNSVVLRTIQNLLKNMPDENTDAAE